MTKVTIIGATGSLGRVATQVLLRETDFDLTLFSRSADNLPDHEKVQKIGASTDEADKLEAAVADSQLVFVALSGDLPKMITQIITAMKAVGTKRLVFISSYGIYGEIAGKPNTVSSILRPYRKAADIVEESGLDYTILRPGWFDNGSDMDYQLIPKGEVIYGNTISRKSIADVVNRIAQNPKLYVKQNLGIVRKAEDIMKF